MMVRLVEGWKKHGLMAATASSVRGEVGRGVLLGGWTVAKAASWRDESPVGVMAAVEVGDMRWWLMLRLELVLHVH